MHKLNFVSSNLTCGSRALKKSLWYNSSTDDKNTFRGKEPGSSMFTWEWALLKLGLLGAVVPQSALGHNVQIQNSVVSYSEHLIAIISKHPHQNLHSISPTSGASCTLSTILDPDSFSSLTLELANMILSLLFPSVDILCSLTFIPRKSSHFALWLSDVLQSERRKCREVEEFSLYTSLFSPSSHLI